MSVVDLYPPITPPSFRSANVEGGLLSNIGAIIKMARDHDTRECRFLARHYAIEYRALSADLPHSEREEKAFRAAWQTMHEHLGTPPIA